MADEFGPFALDRLLGRGGMAEVFIAHRQDDHRQTPLVLKRIRPDLADDSEYTRRFVLEAQVASRLSHPNLVQFHEFGRVGECLYITMEHVDGFSLHRLLDMVIRRHQPPPIEVAIHIAKAILSALAAMHAFTDDDGRSRPMLHRDVTPANVIVTSEGRPVLIDFGITKDVLGPAITIPGKVIGTARYMSPEHRKAEFIDPRADVFSVGVILWELLTAHHPWPPLEPIKEILRTTFDPPDVPAALRDKIPEDLEAVAKRGLACDPADRFLSAGEMSAALLACSAARKLGQRGAELTRAWMSSLGMEADRDLGKPVIDHGPKEAERSWGPDGRIDADADVEFTPGSGDATLLDVPGRDALVLTIPPLPPTREEALGELGDDAELRAAVSRPVWGIAVVIAFVIVAGFMVTILLVGGHL